MAEDTDEIVAYEDHRRAEVIDLWRRCGLVRPWNDPDKDIDRKLTDRNGAFLLVQRGARVIGSVMVGHDGHRGSIYYLSIDPEVQSQGLGKRLMAHCEAFLEELGCPKINLFVRADNAAVLRFYEDLGYATETATPLGKRLIPDI